MADPVSLVGMAASAGGSLISAFGAKQAGSAQAGMYSYQAGIAELNRKIAIQNRNNALDSGELESRKYGLGAAQRSGQITDRMAASGIDIGQGSAQDVRKSQQLVTDIDTQQIRINAGRKAFGYSTEAASDEAQAGMYRSAATNAESAGGIRMAGSLIGGVASVADKWLQGSTLGLGAG